MTTRRIAIIGSGHGGLLAAHGLHQAGYEVTLYSDRTPDQWLNASRPTGSAARFSSGLAYERQLGLDLWEARAPKIRGSNLTVCQDLNNRLLTMTARDQRYGVAIDARIESAGWMREFEAKGGRIEIEQVTPEGLDRIAGEHDLTVVAAGRASLSELFARDPERSLYDSPPRHQALAVARGADMAFTGIPFLPIRFAIIVPAGECFWIPFFHKDVGPTWNLVFDAKPGGPFDVFQGAKSGDEVLATMKRLIKEIIPWDYPWAKDLTLADPNGWLTGRVQPIVRKPVAQLASGRIATGIGDTLMVVDPITGQGSNNASKMAQNLVESVIAHGDRPFDAAFMTETFDRYYTRSGHFSNVFTHLLLEPISAPVKEILIAQYGTDGAHDDGRQALADAFHENFNDPSTLTDTLLDLGKSRALIAEKTGKSWLRAVAAGGMAIAAGQMRQKLGMEPRHPLANVPAPALSAT